MKDEMIKALIGLQDSIKELNDRDRLFLRLHYGENLELAEISEIMGITMRRTIELKMHITNRLSKSV